MTSSFAAGCTTSISRMIVAASEVTKSLPRWLISSLLRPRSTRERVYGSEMCYYAPLGPKLVRTRSDNSATAWIFRSTASSNPETCYRWMNNDRGQEFAQRTLYPSLNSWILLALGTLSDIGRSRETKRSRMYDYTIQVISLRVRKYY